MKRLEHPALGLNPWAKGMWTEDDTPVLIVDEVLYRIKALSEPASGDIAYVIGAGQRELSKLAALLNVGLLHFYGLRAEDLFPLVSIRRLRHLMIHWNSKLTDLTAIGRLADLETLVLIDTPKVRDLSPLEALSTLRALKYWGGLWNSNRAYSLEPLVSLPRLEELALGNVRIDSGGLRSLAGCKSLKILSLSNQFPTEDYAYLSIALPEVKCEYFAPWVRVDGPNGTDTMIIGRRKPFLNSRTDAERIVAYEEAFRRLQAKFKLDGDAEEPKTQ